MRNGKEMNRHHCERAKHPRACSHVDPRVEGVLRRKYWIKYMSNSWSLEYRIDRYELFWDEYINHYSVAVNSVR